MLGVLLTVVTTLLFCWYVRNRHPWGFPPGPRWSLPFLGDILVLGSNIVTGIGKLREKHGDIIGLNLGPLRAVVISDLEAIQEASVKEEFMDRPAFFKEVRVELLPGGALPGVGFSNGSTWSEQRRFSLHKLRDFGFGKLRMEELIEEQVERLCDKLAEDQGKATEVDAIFSTSIISVLWTILTSEQLSYDHPTAKFVYETFSLADEISASPFGFLASSSPLVVKILDGIGLTKIQASFLSLHELCNKVVNEHKATYEEGELRDFVDAYIAHARDPKTTSPSFQGAAGDINLETVVQDFFAAGTATISLTITWAMLFLANRPELQEKLRSESNEVTGGTRLLRYSDRGRTPLLEAFLHETQRRADVVPFSLFRECIRDTTFRGHFIPRGTTILPNIGAVLNDPKVFPDPKKFDPYRHINEAGSFVPNKYMIAFGLGKRRCVGETLAKAELYQYVSGILSSFDIHRAGTDRLPEESMPLALSKPKKFKIRFVKL